jgi:hypothetical protein
MDKMRNYINISRTADQQGSRTADQQDSKTADQDSRTAGQQNIHTISYTRTALTSLPSYEM